MPKAGTYDYPVDDLDRCVDKLVKARKTSNMQVMKRETFASSIPLSQKTSAFGSLVGSMVYYGLVDTGGGQIRVTELGETIVYGEPAEVSKAKAQAVRSVLLFADIYDKFGNNPTDEQVKIFLREKANVELSKAGEVAGEVGKLLKSNLQYLKATTGGGGETKSLPDRQGGGTGTWALSTDTYGELRIVDELSANFAIQVLNKFKERFGPQTAGDIKIKDIPKYAEAAVEQTFPNLKKSESPK
jgi:hypothetical protein